MNVRALRSLLRECAVLMTALAFIMSGALTPRQHAEAAAFGVLAGDGFVLCHPDAAGAGNPIKLPADHHCDQCVAHHMAGLTVDVLEIAAARDWREMAQPTSAFGLHGAALAALPFATGPPAA